MGAKQTSPMRASTSENDPKRTPALAAASSRRYSSSSTEGTFAGCPSWLPVYPERDTIIVGNQLYQSKVHRNIPITKTFLLLTTAISLSANPTLAQEGRLPFCAEQQSQKLLSNLIAENFSVKVLAYDETPTQIDFSGDERHIVESESANTRQCYT